VREPADGQTLDTESVRVRDSESVKDMGRRGSDKEGGEPREQGSDGAGKGGREDGS